MMEQQTPQQEEVRKEYRTTQAEWQNIEVMMRYAYKMGFIKKLTWQAFVTRLLDLGLTYLKEYEIRQRRGLG